jgi:hypothetical protein
MDENNHMPNTPESNLWQAVKSSAPPKTFLQRVENRHGGGLPDCFVLLDQLSFWIELKVAKTATAKISPHQVAWHTSYWARGGLSFFLLKAPSTPCFVLFRGSSSIDLAQKPWTEVQGSRFDALPAMWEALRAEVRGHYEQALRV